MTAWLTWRTIIGSLLAGSIYSIMLFHWSDKQFSLSGTEIFFAVTTIISLALNLWQLIRDRYRYGPLKGSMFGLLNDLKSRQLRAYQRQALITSPAGMALPLEAVRLEFYDFAGEAIQGGEQLKEHVVGIIHTLDPAASTQQVIRASEFGLTEQDRRLREQFLERQMQTSPPVSQDAAEGPHPETASGDVA